MSYDIVSGLDNQTLNSVIAQVYTAVYPNIFVSSIPVDEVDISTVDFNISTAPTVNLGASTSVRQHVEQALIRNVPGYAKDLPPAYQSRLLDLAAAATLEFTATNVALTVNYANSNPPTNLTATLTGSVSVQSSVVNGQNTITAQMVGGQIDSGNPIMDQILNSSVLPYLITYINTSFLSPIAVPPLNFQGVTVSLPVPAVQAPDLCLYSALGATQPDIPAPFNWPSGCIFIGADSAALQAAADIPFPLGPSTGFDWDIISGSVGAQVLAPSEVVINSNGSLTATIVAQAWATLTVETPWPLPNFSFGPTATATLTAQLQPSIQNNEVYVTIEGVPIPTFNFTWGSIPGWVEFILSPLLDGLSAALNAVLGPLIGNALQLPPIPVYGIPQINIPFPGQPIQVNINQATTSAGGPGGNLLLVSAQLSVTKVSG